MTAPPPHVTAPARRHRSRQRQRILAWLQATDRHPTASQIHAAMREELPALSLGTVYRNLEVLVAEGSVDEVPSAVGATRYDGNLTPHHHFSCERCGEILDIEVPVPRGLAKRITTEHGLRVRRVRMSFVGLCSACEDTARSSGEQPSQT